MTDKNSSEDSEQKPKTHWVLWSVVTAFIVLAIAGMWAVDYYFSPEMINSNNLPEAVGK